jgi:hypothetical protein
VPALNTLATKSYKGKTYADFVHFVHIYVIEAHPKAPDISPYSGNVWEMSWSDKAMPQTYAARVANAKASLAKLQGKQMMLVDDLTPRSHDNPAWCTYGTCPNCSFLIGQDGRLVEVLSHTPKSAAQLELALKKLLP